MVGWWPVPNPRLPIHACCAAKRKELLPRCADTAAVARCCSLGIFLPFLGSLDLDRPRVGGSLLLPFVGKHFTGLVGPRLICISLLVFCRRPELSSCTTRISCDVGSLTRGRGSTCQQPTAMSGILVRRAHAG
jgi:hypothetical protein